MISLGLARRYAKALFNSATAAGQVDTVGEDLKLIATSLTSSPSLGVVLGHPRIAGSEKSQLVRKAFEGHLHELTMRFMLLVLDKQRQEVLPLLAQEYGKLLAQSRSQITAHVRSAVPLTDSQRKSVAEKLGQVTGKSVLLEETIDSGLIGGLIIRYGDKQLDGSVRHHLDQIRSDLKKTRVALD